jgi:hypothetical protein
LGIFVNGTLDDRADTDRGWTCELAIPFARLGRQTPRSGERWKANLYRIDIAPEPAEFRLGNLRSTTHRGSIFHDALERFSSLDPGNASDRLPAQVNK